MNLTFLNKGENSLSNPCDSFCAPGIKKPIGEVSNLNLFTQKENSKLGLVLPSLC